MPRSHCRIRPQCMLDLSKLVQRPINNNLYHGDLRSTSSSMITSTSFSIILHPWLHAASLTTAP
uniref:Uncharacterized protein n=1 Tax=Arundo donax TaxID=35708 RepID=A0A0A9AHA8_ARUDO